MAAVGFAVKPAGRYSSVQVSRVRRADLQEVGDGYAHVAYGPKLVPGPGVMVEGFGERFVAADCLYGIDQWLIYGVVTRAVDGDHLLDAHGAILFDIEGQCLLDVVVRLVEVTTYAHHLVLPVNPGASCLGDVYV